MSENEDPRTFTQDEVNSMLAKAKREHKDELARFSDYEDIKSQVGSLTSERDALTAERDQLSSRASDAESVALRYTVAGDKGIDLGFASRLKGSTKEELEADAEDFLSRLPKPQAQATPPKPTAPPAPKSQDGKSRAAAALRGMQRGA